jgi:hypothetical protein
MATHGNLKFRWAALIGALTTPILIGGRSVTECVIH